MFIPRRRLAASTSVLNFWPAVSDMILAALFVALFLFFGVSAVDLLTRDRLRRKVHELEQRERDFNEVQSKLAETVRRLNEILIKHSDLEREYESTAEARRAAEARLRQLMQELNAAKSSGAMLGVLQRRIAELEALLDSLKERNRKLTIDVDEWKRKHDKPPNITLSGAENFNFDTGSAVLTPEFKKNMQGVLPQLLEAFRKYPVEVIEIIGHTDKQAAGGHQSNLDKKLVPVLEGKEPVTSLSFGSNADLGLMRAVALREFVLEYLRGVCRGDYNLKLTEEERIKLERVQSEIRTYSAAQGVPAAGSAGIASPDSPADRRIEIRFTRLKE